jgi:hypothetical protein
MAKDIAEMTLDELNALPVYQQFSAIDYTVQSDGTVTLPDGRVLSELTPGHTIRIPYETGGRAAFFAGPKTPLAWSDANGEMWTPVKLKDGTWRKERH